MILYAVFCWGTCRIGSYPLMTAHFLAACMLVNCRTVPWLCGNLSNSQYVLIWPAIRPLSLPFPFIQNSALGRTLLSRAECSRWYKVWTTTAILRSYELYKCSRGYYELPVALPQKKTIFTRAFSANCLLSSPLHSAWLLTNAAFGSSQWSS